MAATALNTLHYARRLKSAGVPDGQAEKMAEALDEALVTHLPTKTDFAELKADFAGLRADVTGDVAALRVEFAELRVEFAELRAEFAELRAHVDTQVANLRTDMQSEFKALYKHLWLMAAGIVALNVTLTVTLIRTLS